MTGSESGRTGALELIDTEETRLIGEAQKGDAAAFERLVRLYDQKVLRLALRIVRSEDEVQDVYQEVFLKVFRSLRRFRHECSFETWLFRIVTNVCLDRLRRAGARPQEVPMVAAADVGNGVPVDTVADGRVDGDPERALARREIEERIEAALTGLAPRERLVFELRHHEGMRLREIAQTLDTTEETTRNCLFRAHQRMRSALRDLGGVGSGVLGPQAGPAQAEI